jgi:CHAD domain-containing protein
MREYALARTVDLFHHLDSHIKQLRQAPRDHDADAIHDVRVAIRRLRRCLRLFSRFYPDNSWKKVRRALAGIMQSCGKVRDRDIAIGLLAEAGMPTDSKLIVRLQKQRRTAGRDLRRDLSDWKQSGLGKKFQAALEA